MMQVIKASSIRTVISSIGRRVGPAVNHSSLNIIELYISMGSHNRASIQNIHREHIYQLRILFNQQHGETTVE